MPDEPPTGLGWSHASAKTWWARWLAPLFAGRWSSGSCGRTVTQLQNEFYTLEEWHTKQTDADATSEKMSDADADESKRQKVKKSGE